MSKLEVLKQFLESMPKWVFPVATMLACTLYPGMEKAVMIPQRKVCKVIWKGKILLAPSKKDGLLFVYPRPFQRWLSIRKGDEVFEGGSALGEDTVRIASLVGAKGKVFAAEPDPTNLKFLKVNVRAFRNVLVIPKGIWNSRTELSFIRRGPLSGSIFPSEPEDNETGRRVRIPVDSTDNMVQGQKVDVLKLNIEGAEIEALEGAKHTLRDVREVLIAAHHIRDGQYTATRVVDILRKEGFIAKIVHGILAHHYVVAKRPIKHD